MRFPFATAPTPPAPPGSTTASTRDISRTLEENGILDKDEDFYSGRMDRDLFSQSIGLYSTSIPLNFDLICKDVRKW